MRLSPLPAVQNAQWSTAPIDYFVLSKLESAGLSPSPPADKRTLIRRVTFDLIGLPPTPEEVGAFVADDSLQAFEKVVDRLLASPHYGERWARHWLDLVRFAETLGHEFDYEHPNAWRYRDYCIRAFNADMAYNQFVVEHIAGDLLANPRRHPTEGFNEPIIGTGFFWLGEASHSPVDVRQTQTDRIDNQMDVFGKTFLAQTIGCARCHDHKFDAISAKDYYSLAGYMKSSRYQQAFLDPPERITAKTERLAELRQQLHRAVTGALKNEWNEQTPPMARYLLAARQVMQSEQSPQMCAEVAEQFDLLPDRLEHWSKALQQPELKSPQHAFYVWTQLAGREDLAPEQFRERCESLRAAHQNEMARAIRVPEKYLVFEDFNRPNYDRWFNTGDAFGSRPTQTGELLVQTNSDDTARLLPGGWAHSGRVSNRLEGVLRSETFTIEKRYIHYRMAGKGGHVNLVVDGFTLIRDPIYGGLTIELNDDKPAWRRMDVAMWQGHRAYIEIIDSTTPSPTRPMSTEAASGQPGNGTIAVDEIDFSDDDAPPNAEPSHQLAEILHDPPLDSIAALANRYQSLVARWVDCWLKGMGDSAECNDAIELLNWLQENRLLQGYRAASMEERDIDSARHLTELAAAYRAIEATIPAPTRAVAMADGTGEDEQVLLRGNYKTPGERAPRQSLEAIAGPDQPAPEYGSGRLELAKRITDPSNPLTARVMVNRIWQHHFGFGIVRTPDDFGRMGEPPTHPELLDHLANEFVRRGWSMKEMHRLMLLSNTYRMSSRPDPNAERLDPQNNLLHHMPTRRLEAETVRDSILAVTGGLDPQSFGPSIPPHLTSFMEGRGRPGQTGPLDGAGRRSIYVNVRRNFLTPMFLAFDYPIPFTTIGRRTVSNVPAQALTLMNNPFVLKQANRWADHVAGNKDQSPGDRVTTMYLTAFSRPPSEAELDNALGFVEEQSERYGSGQTDTRAWADLAHVLMNAKEFIFIH